MGGLSKVEPITVTSRKNLQGGGRVWSNYRVRRQGMQNVLVRN